MTPVDRRPGDTGPWWVPGTRHAYHSNTYGHLVGELARRIDGRLPGAWLRDEIAGPLDADLVWGLPLAEQARCADVVWEIDVDRGIEWLSARAETDEQRMIASFGHFGTGGAVGFADPQASVGFGYVMNAVRPRWQSPRNRALINALYACL